MKLTNEENKEFHVSIKQIQEGLQSMLELYSNVEEDIPVIKMGDDVLQEVQKAKRIFGDKFVDSKINNLIKEVISFLPLEDYEDEEPEGTDQ